MKLMVLFLFVGSLLFPIPGALAQQADFVGSKFVADATEHLTGHRAHMSNEIRLLAGTHLRGPATTLRLVRDEKASSMAVGLAVVKLLETTPEGSVVIAVLEDEKGFAVFGAAFGTLAKARKLAGFVVDGSVRDLQELKRLGFPTLARGTVPGSAGGHYRLEGTNVPVQCGGIEVNPGDYVVADADGVAVSPGNRREEILAAAGKMQRDERALLPLIEKHGSYLKAMQERKALKQQD
jgi:regulator of RNase E activity RraA